MRGLADAEGSAAGFSFLFRNSSLRLAFLLIVDGLGIFLGAALVSKAGTLSLVSREKEKAEPIEREKLKALPWLASVWQKSKYLVAKED